MQSSGGRGEAFISLVLASGQLAEEDSAHGNSTPQVAVLRLLTVTSL